MPLLSQSYKRTLTGPNHWCLWKQPSKSGSGGRWKPWAWERWPAETRRTAGRGAPCLQPAPIPDAAPAGCTCGARVRRRSLRVDGVARPPARRRKWPRRCAASWTAGAWLLRVISIAFRWDWSCSNRAGSPPASCARRWRRSGQPEPGGWAIGWCASRE